ncbi:MAG: FAD-dependent oxidoreductase [Alphaproteobacteria bacterium]|uniref:FAD-dependent oxidoreductase n=1 Tax=Candidatus Nitrobium versatile TaxID=2884831 RepID=A0A953J6I7_9BACT|nr:FAD-dependent oxidoreductase [Candidatus Nitrobium versatile]
MEKYDIIIAGAGISGLGLAYFCAEAGMEVLVLEESERTGGCFHSNRFGKDAGDFWLELGAHTCYNSYTTLIRIMEGCGILDRVRKREKVPFRMLADDRICSIPSQLDLLELLLSAPRFFTAKKGGKSVEEYYAPLVGRRNFKKVFSPAFNAVVSQDAGGFPADMLFRKRARRKDILKSFTLEGGLQVITDSLSARKGISVLTGRAVRTVAYGQDRFSVVTGDGTSFSAASLALATPAPVAAGLLRVSFPDVADLLSGIALKTIETVGVVFDTKKVSYPPMAGLIAVDDSFFSAVSRDTVPHPRYRGLSFHFKPELLDEAAKRRRIAEVVKTEPEHLEKCVFRRSALPSLAVGQQRLVEAVDSRLAGKRLLLTGNYFLGLAIEDCVSRSLSEFTRLRDLLG